MIDASLDESGNFRDFSILFSLLPFFLLPSLFLRIDEVENLEVFRNLFESLVLCVNGFIHRAPQIRLVVNEAETFRTEGVAAR